VTPRTGRAARPRGGIAVLLFAALALCLLAGGSAGAAGAAGQARAEGDGPDVSRLRARGWVVPGALPRRLRLVLAEERRLDGRPFTGAEDVASTYVHLGYSDGRSTVSVFVQQGRLDAARLVNWHVRERFGHTIWTQESDGRNAIWSSGEHVYTLFADAPADVVDSVIATLPHEDEPGFWERLSRNVARAVAWANPFGCPLQLTNAVVSRLTDTSFTGQAGDRVVGRGVTHR
jgi:hypothetical protein